MAKTKSTISFDSAHEGGTPKSTDETWDAAAEVNKASGDADKLRTMHSWVDSEADNFDAENSELYKLPHHKGDGDQDVVWQGLKEAAAIVHGLKDAGIPESDLSAIREHLGKHYREFDRTPPWEEETLQDRQIVFGVVKDFDRKKAEETRTIPFIASTDDVDRHGTVVNQSGWKLDNFNVNPIIGYQHDVYGGGLCNKADPDDVIGGGVAKVADLAAKDSTPARKQLEIDITFEPKELNEHADKIFRKILHGTLRAVSVGFMPIGDGRFGRKDEDGEIVDKDIYFFDGQELLEVSVVNIPANAQALRRSFRNSTAEAIRVLKKELGAEFSYSDIEKLSVGDIIKFLEKGIKPEKESEDPESPEASDTEVNAEDQSEEEGNKSNSLELKKKRLHLRERELKSIQLQP